MHNKVIVRCLANVFFATSKFLHSDYKAIQRDLRTGDLKTEAHVTQLQ